MTPKEKSQQLIKNYKDQNYDFESFDGSERDANAKQCALICVDEIIESYPTSVKTFNSSKGLHVIHEDNRKYWQEVRTEIQNL